MQVHKLIIHEIAKEENQTEKADLHLSEEILKIDVAEIDFIDKLNKKYRTLRQSNGTFENEEGFHEEMKEYFRIKSDESFLDFTTKTMRDLRPLIKRIAPAKGGYVIFADYEDSGKFLGIFIVRNKTGNRLIKKEGDKSFQINYSLHVDLENLHMACRINRERYNNSETSYITFINKTNIDSQYFIYWIGASDIINDKEDTHSLLSILKSIAPPKGEDGKPISSSDFIKNVYTLIKSTPRGNYIDLKQISNAFYNDENFITDYAQDNDIQINHTFKPDNSELRKFVDIKVKSNKIDLSFPQEYVETGVISIKGNQIIINSEDLVAKIKAEII